MNRKSTGQLLAWILAGTAFLLFCLPLQAQDNTVINANSPRDRDGRGFGDRSELFNPENSFGIGLRAGAAIPLGEYSGDEQFAGTGLFLEGTAGYSWKTWGVGVQAGTFNSPVSDNVREYLDGFELPYADFFNKNHWNVTYLGIGPDIQIQSVKWPVHLYMKGGFMYYNSPQFSASTEVMNNDFELINYREEKFSTPYISLGGEFGYRFSRNWSLLLNLSYISGISPQEFTYSYRNLEMFGDPPYNDDEVIESRILEEEIEVNPTVINLGLGVRYTFGGRKPSPRKIPEEPKRPEEEQPSVCFPVELFDPDDQSNIYINRKERPTFSWREREYSKNKPESYVLMIYNKANNPVFSERTKKTRLEHSDKLEEVYQVASRGLGEGESTTLNWQVISKFKDCEDQESNKRSISLQMSTTGLVIDFKNIQCVDPAFDEEGNARYTAEVELINHSSDNSLTVYNSSGNTFTVTNTSDGDSEAVSNSNPSGDISLPVNGTETVTFEFTRPVGENTTVLHVPYSVDGLNMDTEEFEAEDLPSCVCNVCDEWKIYSKYSTGQLNEEDANVAINGIFAMYNADPIQEVKAEIVYVQHQNSDEECYTCTTEEDIMGMFSDYGKSGKLLVNTSSWMNNGQATLSDENADGYGNQFTWQAISSQGVDLSQIPYLQYDLYLNLPKSNLSCCIESYKICIRFTFTDINCQTCDKLVCYKFSPRPGSAKSVNKP